MTRGRRRLKIAPVGDIRRRWASVLQLDDSVIRDEVSEVSETLDLSSDDGCRDRCDVRSNGTHRWNPYEFQLILCVVYGPQDLQLGFGKQVLIPTRI